MNAAILPRPLRSPGRPSRSRFLLAALLPLVLGIGACTEKLAPATLGSIRLTPGSDSFFVGQTSAPNPFAVTLIDQNGNEIRDGRRVTFSSLNEVLFTVDAVSGAVTGKTTGSGVLRATVDSRFAEAAVKIIHAVARIQLISGNLRIQVGSTVQLQYNLLAENNSTIVGRQVGHSSNNVNVATVSNSGLVSAISEGTAVITISSEGKTAQVTITVERRAVASIRLTPSINQTLRPGGTLQVTAVALDNNQQEIVGQVLNWSSTNSQVATVSSTGRITANVLGNTTIIAEADGRTATLGVAVAPVPAVSVALQPAVDTLVVNDVRQFTPVVVDSLGRTLTSFTGRSISWQSSNLTTATVTNQGVVNGVAVGTATITVTVDGLESNPLQLTIAQIASVALSPAQTTVAVGATFQYQVTLKDLQGNTLTTSRPLQYSSSNPSVASVSPAGIVSPLRAGTATITAVANGVVGQANVTVTQ